MADKLKPGDEVSWDTFQGATHGNVVKKLTSTTRIKATSPTLSRTIRSTSWRVPAAGRPAGAQAEGLTPAPAPW